MTDHRATDLSYGHLGEASYDLDNKSWHFSSDRSLESSIEPLQQLQECIPPSLRVLPNSTKTASKVRSSQERWLRKTLPEAGPAKATITSAAKAPNPASVHHPSTLLTMGKAVDMHQMTGTRSTQIMAMVHGEAGNLLRLIKPRVEALKWESQHDTKLRSLNPTAGEDCYWLGSGGAIQQLAFGADSDGSTSWLAVLKPESTTIFRPIYHRVQTPSSIDIDIGRKYPPSRLSANPILSLDIKRTGASPHADVSFNPWYIRQFAIIDQQGHWSLWDIEGQKRKRTTFEAKLGRSGHIHDDSSSEQGFKSHDSADGWARVLWAGGVSTLILCDRRNLAVFDLKVVPKRLHSPEVVHPRSVDWILDMKRSPVNLSYVFLLTTRQIFWLQIAETGEDQDEQLGFAGAKILLSCQHFRNQDDETAKLELLGEDEGCTVLLYSAQSPHVNTYRFTLAMGESRRPVCSQGSFVIDLINNEQMGKLISKMQTLCLLSTTFMLHNLKPMSGPAKQYADHNVRFYQLFGISETLGMFHALCSTKWVAHRSSNSEPIKYHTVLAPTIKDGRIGRFKSSVRVIEDHFIVPDGLEEDDDTLISFNDLRRALPKSVLSTGHQNKVQDSLFLSVDARRLYKVSFLNPDLEGPEDSASPQEIQSMVEHSKAVQSGVEERKSSGFQGLVTLLDLLEYKSFSEDVDEAASILRALMDELSSTAEAADKFNATPLTIRPSPFVQSDRFTSSAAAILNLSDVYDNLVDLWVGCLPRITPGSARLAKEKLVRSAAAELCLSSLGVFIRDRSVILPKPAGLQEGAGFVLAVRTKTDSSETLHEGSPQTQPVVPTSSLPTPVATPSLPSNNSSTSLRESIEDGAISRLRGYAVSIKSQPQLGASRSAILAHWPSTPGADPLKYSWDASRQSVAQDEGVDSDEEEALIRKREQDRRRRRTEKFLKRQRVNTIDEASQPLPTLTLGSQPDPAQHPVSSQAADIPMTQPDRGAFGSRIGPKGFKKRRTMGF